MSCQMLLLGIMPASILGVKADDLRLLPQSRRIAIQFVVHSTATILATVLCYHKIQSPIDKLTEFKIVTSDRDDVPTLTW